MRSGNKKIWVIAFCFGIAVLYQQCASSKTNMNEKPAAKQDAIQTQGQAPALSVASQTVELATSEASAPAQRQKAGSPPEGGTPLIVIAAPIFDAGEVWEGETVVHSFAVKNTGNGVLTINSVKPG